MKKNRVTGAIFLVLALVLAFISADAYSEMHEEEVYVNGPGVTEERMLSDYFPKLKGTNGDSEIYIFEGEKEGGSMLVLGGTHPNEPASNLAAVLMIENIEMEAGTLYVIPRANNSAFTHNDPQEGAPSGYTIEGPNGDRFFRYGSRATNPIDQWPDPDVYIHDASGQQLSGSETRNLNRGYPGRPDGTLTEQMCYAITELIIEEDIDMSFDLHEASPEYPVINAIVAHDRAMPIASDVAIKLQLQGIQIGLEPSPTNLRGLTHREWGNFTDTLPILMETANPSQGRLRGKTDEELVLTGQDDGYVKAAELGRLFVPFDESGHPMEERVGRHITALDEFAKSFTKMYEDRPIIMKNVPEFDKLQTEGIGYYLNPLQ